MIQLQERSIRIRRRGATLSTDRIQQWDSSSSVGNEILGLFPHDMLPENRIVNLGRSVPVDIFRQALHENLSLRQEVRVLKNQVAQLMSAVGLDQPESRKIKKSEAKREVAAYFEAHPDQTIYPSDVTAALNLEYDLVLDVIEQLENEGQVAKAEA